MHRDLKTVVQFVNVISELGKSLLESAPCFPAVQKSIKSVDIPLTVYHLQLFHITTNYSVSVKVIQYAIRIKKNIAICQQATVDKISLSAF